MHYLILHCRHCSQRVWIPENKLGSVGKCPDCGEPMPIPADLGPYAVFEAPHFMREFVGTGEECLGPELAAAGALRD